MRTLGKLLPLLLLSLATSVQPQPIHGARVYKAQYACKLTASEPRIVDACGRKMCRYIVLCFALAEEADGNIMGDAFCPMRGTDACAPYGVACKIHSAETADEVWSQFKNQCEDLRRRGSLSERSDGLDGLVPSPAPKPRQSFSPLLASRSTGVAHSCGG